MVYINDMDENTQGMISKFAAGTKVDCVIDSEDGCQNLQQDLN